MSDGRKPLLAPAPSSEKSLEANSYSFGNRVGPLEKVELTKGQIMFRITLLCLMQTTAAVDKGMIPWLLKNIHKDLAFQSSIQETSLNSLFLVGLIFGVPVVNYFANKTVCYPFLIVAAGMAIFCIAEFSSGFVETYWQLAMCRALSGAGDAVMNVIAIPWIDRNASPNVKGSAIASFMGCWPLGIALGSILGGKAGWRECFQVQAGILCALSLLGFCCPDRDEVDQPRQRKQSFSTSYGKGAPKPTKSANSRSSKSDRMQVLTNPIAWMAILGFAGLMASTSGAGIYMALYCLYSVAQHPTPADQNLCIYGLGFGTAIASVIGTIMGGLIVDIASRAMGRRSSPVSFLVASFFAAASIPVLMVAYRATDVKTFLIVYCGGILLLMSSTSSYTPGLIWLVPVEQRSHITALNGIVFNLLGSVPAPLAVGLVKDALWPCPKPPCIIPKELMYLCVYWMAWPAVLWLLAAVTSKCMDEGVLDESAGGRRERRMSLSRSLSSNAALFIKGA